MTSPAVDNGGSTYDSYFTDSPSPPYLESTQQRVLEFAQLHQSAGRRIVLSGGTTVPLESHTVRFLDNFSAGTRGSVSTEHFLQNDYAVVFLHRQFSLEPFTREFTHSKACFLDLLEQDTVDGSIKVKAMEKNHLSGILSRYTSTQQQKTLLKVHFVTVTEYLFLLRGITQVLAQIGGESVLYYLAAAVSDFYIPPNRMVEHKIQSQGTPLSVTFEPVPKMLCPLVKEWARTGLIVSFKLETDPSLLVSKSRSALSRYGHQVVIGNLLTTRKQSVSFITLESVEECTLLDREVEQGVEIEERIVKRLVEMHSRWIVSRGGVAAP